MFPSVEVQLPFPNFPMNIYKGLTRWLQVITFRTSAALICFGLQWISVAYIVCIINFNTSLAVTVGCSIGGLPTVQSPSVSLPSFLSLIIIYGQQRPETIQQLLLNGLWLQYFVMEIGCKSVVYVAGFFSPNYKLTIGVDFALKVIYWDENTKINLQLWYVLLLYFGKIKKKILLR